MSKYEGKYDRTTLRFPVLTGPVGVQSIAGGYWGRTTVGSAVNIVAASHVTAASLIFLTLENIVVGSETGAREMSVLSKNPGVGFTCGPTNSVSLANSYTLNWLVVNPTT